MRTETEAQQSKPSEREPNKNIAIRATLHKDLKQRALDENVPVQTLTERAIRHLLGKVLLKRQESRNGKSSR